MEIKTSSEKLSSVPRQASDLGEKLEVRFQKTLRGGRDFVLAPEFQVPSGITILFGPSGAGKTTLLDCIAGLATPESGRIAIGDNVLFDTQKRINLSVARRQIGYVFQDLFLFPHLSVESNLEYGLSRLSAKERRNRCRAILESFRIAHLADQRPDKISGGERQRAALARSLVTDPRILLLDEPLAALDVATKSTILEDLRSWNQLHRIPILYVTHSREEVFALGDGVLVIEDGRIFAQGTPHEVMRAPRQELVAQLAGFENIFDARVSSLHEERGTMTCDLAGSSVHLETPLIKADVGSPVRVAISAGDILLANLEPVGISARNILRGRILTLDQKDVIVTAKVDCGVAMDVHLTLAARDSLHLQPGREVWLIVKTHSCHLLAK